MSVPISSLSGAVSGILSGVFISSAGALAQVPNADLACYLHTPDGVQFDLSALCGGFSESAEVILQTGDVQVTLRWDTADDLDLYVQDPAGDEVYFGNTSIPSGGLLDVDANAGCAARMAAPVENIFWPTGEGVPGDYIVTVDLFSHCGPETPINFTITTLVKGVTTSQSGTVSATQSSLSFPFSFPTDDATAADATLPTELPTDTASTLPALP
ncbi:MAG: hypothetical protein AAF703_04040 [Cyanobacteria bacterium P01_D01_bin.105]